MCGGPINYRERAKLREGREMSSRRNVSWLFALMIGASSITACVDTGSEDAVQLDAQSQSLREIAQEASLTIRSIEVDANRGLIFRSLRASDRQELDDILYEMRLALYRLDKDLGDELAAEVLYAQIDMMRGLALLESDQSRVDVLIEQVKSLLNGLGYVIERELYAAEFNFGFGDFTQITTRGKTTWDHDELRGALKASGFRQGEVEVWLLTPVFDLSEVEIPYFQLEQTIAFFTKWDDIEVLVSSDYKSGNPLDATWNTVEIVEKPKGDINWETIESEKVSLSEYAGSPTVSLAFRYRAGAAGSSVWQIDSFKLGGAGLLSKQVAKPALGLEEKPSSQLTEIYSASFEKDLGEFLNFVTVGETSWSVNEERKVVQISAFKKGASEAWLVSPQIDLSKAKKAELSGAFTTGFFTQQSDMEILVSVDFDKDPSSASWTSLEIDKGSSVEGSNWRDWGSKPASLDKYLGKKIYLGFRYRASEENAATWQIKSLSVRAEK